MFNAAKMSLSGVTEAQHVLHTHKEDRSITTCFLLDGFTFSCMAKMKIEIENK